MTGRKYDRGKRDWTLMPWSALEWVVKVLEHGEQKYERDNWQQVDNGRQRYLAAAFRHLIAHTKGERLDEESGLPHLAHACCCLLFLLHIFDEGKTDVK
jgi:hypothetical protein